MASGGVGHVDVEHDGVAAMEAIEFFDGETTMRGRRWRTARSRNGGHRVLRWRVDEPGRDPGAVDSAAMEAIEFFDGEMGPVTPSPQAGEARAAMEAIEFFDGEVGCDGSAVGPHVRAAMEAIEFFDGELSPHWTIGSDGKRPQWRPSSSSMASMCLIIAARLSLGCRNGGHRVLRWRGAGLDDLHADVDGVPQWRPSSSSMAR